MYESPVRSSLQRKNQRTLIGEADHAWRELVEQRTVLRDDHAGISLSRA